MLVISRREGQSFTLKTPDGYTIEVTLLTMEKTQVKIGIEAPKDLEILRDDAKTLTVRKMPV